MTPRVKQTKPMLPPLLQAARGKVMRQTTPAMMWGMTLRCSKLIAHVSSLFSRNLLL